MEGLNRGGVQFSNDVKNIRSDVEELKRGFNKDLLRTHEMLVGVRGEVEGRRVTQEVGRRFLSY